MFIQFVVHKRMGKGVHRHVVTVATEKPVTMSTALVSMDATKGPRAENVRKVSVCDP